MKSRKTEIGIYLCAMLIMGAISVSSNIENICNAFPSVTQTTVIAYLITIPSIMVIIFTIVTGKLMEIFAAKTLMIFGILLWLVGGTLPFFFHILTPIIVFRLFYGIGIAIITGVVTALIVEIYDDLNERNRVMGNQVGFEMLGALVFSLISGKLGTIGWNVAFLVHLFALIPLVAAIICIPYEKPKKAISKGQKQTFRPSKYMWIWCASIFCFTVCGQAFTNYNSSLIVDLGLGGPAESGVCIAAFSIGGFVMGFLFGRLARITKIFTPSVGILVMVATYITLVFAPSLAVVAIASFFFGFSIDIGISSIINNVGLSVDSSSSGMAVCIGSAIQNAGVGFSAFILTPIGTGIAGRLSGYSINQSSYIGAIFVGIALAIIYAVIAIAQKCSGQN